MKRIILIIAIALVPGLINADDYLTVWVSSQMSLTERNTTKTYGRLAAKQAPLVTQLRQGPNTWYWQISISTNANNQNTFLTTLKNAGKITQVSAFTIKDDGRVIFHFMNYPEDFYKVWQSSK